MIGPRRRGALLVIVAGAMIVLAGAAALVVDIGAGLATRTRHQAAADAGVLAGAWELPGPQAQTRAPQTVVAWIQRNVPGATVSTSDVTIWTHPSGAQALTVKWQQATPTFFGRLLGSDAMEVGVTASATLGGVSEASGLMPFAVPCFIDSTNKVWVATRHNSSAPKLPSGFAIRAGSSTEPFDFSQPSKTYNDGNITFASVSKSPPTEVLLRCDPAGSQNGNFQTLGFDGSGANVLAATIRNGAQRSVSIHDIVTTETGQINSSGVKSAVQARVGDSVLVPLVDSGDFKNLKGTSKVEVVGFLSLKITGVEGKDVYGVFEPNQVVAGRGKIGSYDAYGAWSPLLIPSKEGT